MRPKELGLPFESYRPGQLEAVMDIALSDRPVSALCAPTGAGKSAIYASVAALTEGRVAVLVHTKGLQDQIVRDFQGLGFRAMKGRSNYRCVGYEGPFEHVERRASHCQGAPCTRGVVCPVKDECTYYSALGDALSSKVVVTNYAYWMHAEKNGKALGAFDLLVMDEAHIAPHQLSGFSQVEFRQWELRGKQRLLAATATLEDWYEWGRELKERLQGELASLSPLSVKAKTAKDLMNRVDSFLVNFKMSSSKQWIAERGAGVARLTPLWGKFFAEQYLMTAPRSLLVSATMTRDTCRHLGLAFNNVDWIEMKSPFDKRRRPFVVWGVAAVGARMKDSDRKKWIEAIDKIVGDRRDRKGVIHSRSYSRAKDIMNLSRHGDIMMSARDGETTTELVARFKRAKAPCVLVSPSVEEGYDFPYDDCRYQIIPKIPFLDGREPVTKARTEADKGYPLYEAAQTIVQMAGRGMRSSEDWCETIMIDAHWTRWFYGAVGSWPKWFAESIRVVRKAPEPLNM